MASQPIVLLAPRVTDDSVRIWKAAIDEGWSVQRLGNWRAPRELAERDADLLIYAEPLFAEAIADQLNLRLLEPPPNWLPNVAEKFRHRKIQLCTLNEAKGLGGPLFVKPAEGKVFDARVYSHPDDLPTQSQVDGDLAVIVSEPVNWQLEVRCFVCEGKVMTLSPYWRSGKLAEAADGSWPFVANEEEEATSFANDVIANSEVPPAFVLDIGIIAGSGWSIVEGNPCWGAGLYGCDPREALFTARRAVRRGTVLMEIDKRWLSSRVRSVGA